MTEFLKKWWPTLLTVAVILYATLWPDPVGASEVSLFEHADKLVHAVMMGGLVSAVLFDRRRAGKALTRKAILTAAIGGIIFSAADEVAQKLMALGRSWELADFLADMGGILIACLTAPGVINRIFRKKISRA